MNTNAGAIVALEKGDRTEEKLGGPRASSCTQIETEIPGILEFIAEQRLTDKAGRKFKCLGAWRTEGPDARAAWVKYQIGKGETRVCEVRGHAREDRRCSFRVRSIRLCSTFHPPLGIPSLT